jgi:hypothetical protein
MEVAIVTTVTVVTLTAVAIVITVTTVTAVTHFRLSLSLHNKQGRKQLRVTKHGQAACNWHTLLVVLIDLTQQPNSIQRPMQCKPLSLPHVFRTRRKLPRVSYIKILHGTLLSVSPTLHPHTKLLVTLQHFSRMSKQPPNRATIHNIPEQLRR